MLKKIGCAVAMAGLGLAALTGGAGAATGNETIKIVFTANPRSGIPGTVIARGVANGIGTDETIAQDPHPDGSETDTDLITLPGGTITILDTDPPDIAQFNPASCTATLSGGGPWTVIGGTGAYAGATGAGTFTARGVIVFPHTADGCGDTPRSFFAVVTLNGTISLP